MSCQHVWERRDKQTWCSSYYICTECEMELSTDQYEALQQAHRAGWEQAKREAERMARQKAGHVGFPIDCCQEDYENYLIGSAISDAIANMEYKEAESGKPD